MFEENLIFSKDNLSADSGLARKHDSFDELTALSTDLSPSSLLDRSSGAFSDPLSPDNVAALADEIAAQQVENPTVEVSLRLIEEDDILGITVGEQFAIAVDFIDIRSTRQTVFSGYADILFDNSQLRVDSIEYDSRQLGALLLRLKRLRPN